MLHQPQTDPCRLVVGSTSLGELENDAAPSEATVDLGVGVEAVVDAAALLLVQDDLENLAVVLLGAEALADDLDGVDEIGQDGIVDGSQGARAGALLGLGVARPVGALGAGQDAARGQDQDVAVRELLLQLTGEAVCGGGQSVHVRQEACESIRRGDKRNLPLLDTVEAMQGRDGDKDDNSLLAVANLDLRKDQRNQHASSRMVFFEQGKMPIHGPLPVRFRDALSWSWFCCPDNRLSLGHSKREKKKVDTAGGEHLRTRAG